MTGWKTWGSWQNATSNFFFTSKFWGADAQLKVTCQNGWIGGIRHEKGGNWSLPLEARKPTRRCGQNSGLFFCMVPVNEARDLIVSKVSQHKFCFALSTSRVRWRIATDCWLLPRILDMPCKRKKTKWIKQMWLSDSGSQKVTKYSWNVESQMLGMVGERVSLGRAAVVWRLPGVGEGQVARKGEGLKIVAELYSLPFSKGAIVSLIAARPRKPAWSCKVRLPQGSSGAQLVWEVNRWERGLAGLETSHFPQGQSHYHRDRRWHTTNQCSSQQSLINSEVPWGEGWLEEQGMFEPRLQF